MRVNIVHPGAGELHYEIRSIVSFAHKVADGGVPIVWENIGDPVTKGEVIPDWIIDIVSAASAKQESYAYSPTRGVSDTLSFLSDTRSHETGQKLSVDDIVFFNGLGDAITKVYTWLNPIARVLGPSPAYPTHSSVEGAHGRSEHLTYHLDPENNWMPDIKDVRNKVKYNPSISALLVINPDNPTGAVYTKETLQEFVQIAKDFDLFLIVDEVYANLVYDQESFTSLAEICGNVPTIVMRGLSKEVPWPGSRCGWLEFYNTEKDDQFKTYARSLLEAKMIEVCSTTLPQLVLPEILSHKQYGPYLQQRSQIYQQRAQQAATVLNATGVLQVVQPKGAFYLAVTTKNNTGFNSNFKLSDRAKKLVDEHLGKGNHASDKRFCYELLAETGICTVPLQSGFNSWIEGFRMTLLEPDEKKFNTTLRKIADFATSQ